MTMQTGDKVTIRRGKLRGEVGEVIAHQDNPSAYVLKLGDGTFQVVNVTNVIEPTEATITQGELAAIISSAADNNGHIWAANLVHDLDSKYPGFAGKVSVPLAADEDREPGSTGPSYGAGPGEGR